MPDDDEVLLPELLDVQEEADPEWVFQPDEVAVGTVQVTTPEGGEIAMVLRLEAEDRVDVVISMAMARQVMLAMLEVVDRHTPALPQHDGVFLRAPGGMGAQGIAAALGEVFGAMYETGPARPEDLRAVALEAGLSEATVAAMGESGLRAWHRARHENRN